MFKVQRNTILTIVVLLGLCQMGIVIKWRRYRTVDEAVELRLRLLQWNLVSNISTSSGRTKTVNSQLISDQLSRNPTLSDRTKAAEVFTNKTITAAIFSCNSNWLSMTNLAFPRTIGCPHTDNKITLTAAINNEGALHDADVIIFGAGVNNITWEKAMSVRKPHQIWVYTTAESPSGSPQVRVKPTRVPIGFNEHHFNMSFTYHSKAEVVAPFGEYIPFTKKIAVKKAASILPRKSNSRGKNMVVWVGSHCDLKAWNRTNLVHSLAKYVPVDLFGACGTKPRLPRGTKQIRLLQPYKFYLAFENNCCTEYISEKFWQALAEFELVPIVVGASREHYERVAPPNSFIYADDFGSVRDLARYIRKVAANATLYKQYHQWRMSGKAALYRSVRVHPFSSTEGACTLLRFLEENAWKGNQSLRMRIDPFGPEWLGSCGLCGKHHWLTAYDIASNAYHPHLRTTVYNTSLYGEPFANLKGRWPESQRSSGYQ